MRFLVLVLFSFAQLAIGVQKAPLKGKVALITGASSGIGMVAAQELAKVGMKVVLLARREDKLKEVVADINKAGGEGYAFTCDVGSAASIERAFEMARRKYGGIDFVFSNAGTEGYSSQKNLTDTPDAALQGLMNTNVVGTMQTLKYAIKAFEQRGGGTIAFSSSILAFCGDVCTSALGALGSTLLPYVTSKAAIDMMAEAAHGSYSAQGVRVYNLNIGVFQSEMASRAGFEVDSPAPLNPIMKESVGNPIHIAEVIVAILDGTSKWPPGSSIVIDNDITISSKYFTDRSGTPEFFGFPSPEELKKVAMNIRGEPYVFKGEL